MPPIPPSPLDNYYFGSRHNINHKNQEFLPEKPQPVVFALTLAPGVRANLHLFFPYEDTETFMGFGDWANTSIDPSNPAKYAYGTQWATDLTTANATVYWPDLNGNIKEDSYVYYNLPAVDQTLFDAEHPNGQWGEKAYHQQYTQYGSQNGRLNTGNNICMDILGNVINLKNALLQPNLPVYRVSYNNIEGKHYVEESPGEWIAFARLEITDIPGNVDYQTGYPEVWRLGRCAFGWV